MTKDNEKKGLQKRLKQLQSKRESLSSESEAIYSELASSPGGDGKPVGIHSPLVDDEGYPRADIDVYRVRDLRKRWHEIQNDIKSIMKDLEKYLVQLASLDGTVSCS